MRAWPCLLVCLVFGLTGCDRVASFFAGDAQTNGFDLGRRDADAAAFEASTDPNDVGPDVLVELDGGPDSSGACHSRNFNGPLDITSWDKTGSWSLSNGSLNAKALSATIYLLDPATPSVAGDFSAALRVSFFDLLNARRNEGMGLTVVGQSPLSKALPDQVYCGLYLPSPATPGFVVLRLARCANNGCDVDKQESVALAYVGGPVQLTFDVSGDIVTCSANGLGSGTLALKITPLWWSSGSRQLALYSHMADALFDDLLVCP